MLALPFRSYLRSSEGDLHFPPMDFEIMEIGHGQQRFLQIRHFYQAHIYILIQELIDRLLDSAILREDLFDIIVIVTDLFHDIGDMKSDGGRVDGHPLVLLEPERLHVAHQSLLALVTLHGLLEYFNWYLVLLKELDCNL